MHAKRRLAGGLRRPPDLLQEALGPHQAARRTAEKLGNAPFDPREVDVAVAPPADPVGEVDREVRSRDDQGRHGRDAGAPQSGTKPGQKLLGIDRKGDDVVRSSVESVAGVHPLRIGDHKDRHLRQRPQPGEKPDWAQSIDEGHHRVHPAAAQERPNAGEVLRRVGRVATGSHPVWRDSGSVGPGRRAPRPRLGLSGALLSPRDPPEERRASWTRSSSARGVEVQVQGDDIDRRLPDKAELRVVGVLAHQCKNPVNRKTPGLRHPGGLQAGIGH